MIPEGFRGASWSQFRARASEWSQRASEGLPGSSSAPGPAKFPRGPQRGLLGPFPRPGQKMVLARASRHPRI
eukprot:1262392-Karenia_brevis.AAC.1